MESPVLSISHGPCYVLQVSFATSQFAQCILCQLPRLEQHKHSIFYLQYSYASTIRRPISIKKRTITEADLELIRTRIVFIRDLALHVLGTAPPLQLQGGYGS